MFIYFACFHGLCLRGAATLSFRAFAQGRLLRQNPISAVVLYACLLACLFHPGR
jgi:hypothetical protein